MKECPLPGAARVIIGLIVDAVIAVRYKFVRRWVCPLWRAENKTLEPDQGWVWNDSSDLRWKTCVGKRLGDLSFSDRAQLFSYASRPARFGATQS